jgi:hypothetical protein
MLAKYKGVITPKTMLAFLTPTGMQTFAQGFSLHHIHSS